MVRMSQLLMCVSLAWSVSGAALNRRDEELQPVVTADFPHFVGVERLAAWMDPNVSACTDFYSFACGGFRRRYARFGSVDILSMMQKSNTLLIEKVLNQTSAEDSLSSSPEDSEIFDKLRTYYRSCLDTDQIEQRGFDPIVPLAKAVVRSCGREGSTQGRYYYRDVPLPRIMGEMHALGVPVLFNPVYSKVESSLPQDLRLKIIPTPAYAVNMSTIFNVLLDFAAAGVIDIEHDMIGIAESVWEIEQELVSLVYRFNHARKRHDRDNQFMSLDEFEKATGLDWHEYLNVVGLQGAENVYLWSNTRTWMHAIRYFSRVPPHKLMYFCLWRVAVAHYGKLSSKYQARWAKDIHTQLFPPDYDEPFADNVFRRNCVKETGVHLNYLASHLFTKYAFNATQKAAATILVGDLFGAFRENLLKVEWMDAETRAAAIEKLDNMVSVIGYPDWVSDASHVSDYYHDIQFSHVTYFENAVQAQVFSRFAASVHQLSQTRLNRDGTYLGYPWSINAFHITDQLKVQVNPGILQRPLLSSSNPPEMNYGSLGMVIGHEICHAFDSVGHLLDSHGVRRDWMTKASSYEFSDRAKCFVDQYSQYNVTLTTGESIKVDATRTLAENIADNGGLHVAYLAWRSILDEDGVSKMSTPSEALHGLTPEQVFFIAFGQTWCSVRDDAQTMFLAQKDAHAPNQVRVNGVVANSPDFARAFGCLAKQGDSSTLVRPSFEQCHLF